MTCAIVGLDTPLSFLIVVSVFELFSLYPVPIPFKCSLKCGCQPASAAVIELVQESFEDEIMDWVQMCA